MRIRSKMMCIPLIVTLAVILLSIGFNSSASAETAVRKIKIGMALSLTGPGAATTKPESEGMLDMASCWVNEKLGGWKFLNPKTGKQEVFKYDVVWEDVGYDPARGMAAYNRFRGAKADLIICPCTGLADALAALCARDHMPFVSATVTPGSAKVLPRYVMWGATGYPDYCGAALNWIAKKKPGAKIGVIAADANFGRSFDIPEVKAYAKKLGLELLPVVYVSYPTLSDATIELKRMDGMKPDIIFLQDVAGRAATVVNDAVKLGLWKKHQWMLSTICLPGMLMDLTGNKATGAYGLYFVADPVTHADNEAIKIMRAIFKEKKRKGTLGYEALYQLVGGFIPFVSKALQGSLEKFGYPLTPEQIVYGFDHLKDYDWAGWTAYPMNSSKEHPVAINSAFIYRLDSPDSRPEVGKARCPRITPIAMPKKAVWE